MQIEQNQTSKRQSENQEQQSHNNAQQPSINPNNQTDPNQWHHPQRFSVQNETGPQSANRNSYQGRQSNESFMSFGRMSIEEPVFYENQKISLESNISGKANQIYGQKDLFQNLANQPGSLFHQELFVRDQGSYKQYDIEQKVGLTGNSNNGTGGGYQVHFPVFNNSNSFGFGLSNDSHNHFSVPTNLSSQQFKQRSSEGTSTVPYQNHNIHSPHNQSQSTIKMKNFENDTTMQNNSNVKNMEPKLQQPMIQQQHQKQPEEKVISCKCPRSKCLLMYCECFSKGIMCNATCSCYQCRNNPDFEEKRQNARRIVLERDPNAFSNKLEVVGGQQSSQLAYKRGCNCKKTNCFKKYCECFYAGVKCTYLCKCENCMNGGENAYKG